MAKMVNDQIVNGEQLDGSKWIARNTDVSVVYKQEVLTFSSSGLTQYHNGMLVRTLQTFNKPDKNHFYLSQSSVRKKMFKNLSGRKYLR